MDMYRVHGLTRSYFTRKVTGYLDYTGRPWVLEPGLHEHADAEAAGWNGGIPLLFLPDGTPTWDSTAILEHLDTTGGPSVLPDDPTLRFLAHLLDDFSDEWFYRPAVGSRWSYEDNTQAAGWQLAEELSSVTGFPGATTRELVVATMQASLAKLGVTADNIDTWMDEVLVAWLRAVDPVLAEHGYLLGGRPCLADFAVFGANAAHFVGDPYCRSVVDEHGPHSVAHTHRLMVPWRHEFGDWIEPDDVSEALIGVLAEMGRHYLPWVAEATREGGASIELAPGIGADISSTPFLDRARGIMLGRYVAARSPQLDAILERAGILAFFADHVDQASDVPDPVPPAQPPDNRPYAIN